ncbi:hypothetical protein FRC08_017193 [Ceratobasidium sp. 394]|nr:hypothetical protein FRC08_017193 [Ceratobasidium sp. 394]
MRRSAIRIWERAASNVPGLPPCPFDMCEPAYAALIFSPWCSECGVQRAERMTCVFPELRVRLCESCASRCLVKFDSISPQVPYNSVHRDLRGYCLRSDVETTASIINGALSATDKVSLEVWGVKKELEVLQRTTLNRLFQHAQSIYSIMEDQERKRKAVLSQARRHE